MGALLNCKYNNLFEFKTPIRLKIVYEKDEGHKTDETGK